MEDGHEIDAKFEKWRKPLQWGIALLILLIAYLVVYPALIRALVSKTKLFEDLPSWLDSFLLRTLVPIDWLMANVRPYEVYLEWLKTVFPI